MVGLGLGSCDSQGFDARSPIRPLDVADRYRKRGFDKTAQRVVDLIVVSGVDEATALGKNLTPRVRRIDMLAVGRQVEGMDADRDTHRPRGVAARRSDGQLLAASAAGDAEAFCCFYRRHEQQIVGYAIAHCANPSDVADVVGETFLAALRSAARFTERDGDATAWLFGIARQVLAHQRRSFTRRQRLVTRLQTLPRFTPDEAVAVEAAILVDRIRSAHRRYAATGVRRAV